VPRRSAPAFVVIALAATLAAGCATGGTAEGSSPARGGPDLATASAAASLAAGAPTASDRCSAGDVVSLHQAPDLEAVLPTTVGGRPLAIWSVVGRCLIEIAFALPDDQIDALIGKLGAGTDAQRVDITHLTYAVAGRSDTTTDPPYFVFAVGRPQKDSEIGAAMELLFGLIGFTDIKNAPDLTRYQERSIADHTVYVGDAGMLKQDEHQRGRPYLYQTDDALFLVVTDDEAWAKDAISQLP
jgi:hypothetical protein